MLFTIGLSFSGQEVRFTIMGNKIELKEGREFLLPILEQKFGQGCYRDNGSDIYIALKLLKAVDDIDDLFQQASVILPPSSDSAAPPSKKTALPIFYQFDGKSVHPKSRVEHAKLNLLVEELKEKIQMSERSHMRQNTSALGRLKAQLIKEESAMLSFELDGRKMIASALATMHFLSREISGVPSPDPSSEVPRPPPGVGMSL